MQPVPTGDNEGAEMFETEGVPPGYVYIHTPLPKPQVINDDAFAKDRKCDQEIIADLPTNHRTTTD